MNMTARLAADGLDIELGSTRSVFWDAQTPAVGYVDQRLLPNELLVCRAAEIGDLIEAIAGMAVRGAPAIGIAGAYGVALIRQTLPREQQAAAIRGLRAVRPTAIHLAYAVDRVAAAEDPLREAQEIHREQISSDRTIAVNALRFFPEATRVLTHCHTGALATAGEGTALGAILAAYRAGRVSEVFVDETRPLLQGARLTQWELQQSSVPSTLIIESAAAMLMAAGKIDMVIVGADRIAKNRDTANKIGTYMLAVAAKYHNIPFYVAAPVATFDETLESGRDIVIEERAALEVRGFGNVVHAATGPAFNPAFDVTPSELITAIITEAGIR
jgi:methylthioribose-1-phosphate isomerase